MTDRMVRVIGAAAHPVGTVALEDVREDEGVLPPFREGKRLRGR